MDPDSHMMCGPVYKVADNGSGERERGSERDRDKAEGNLKGIEHGLRAAMVGWGGVSLCTHYLSCSYSLWWGDVACGRGERDRVGWKGEAFFLEWRSSWPFWESGTYSLLALTHSRTHASLFAFVILIRSGSYWWRVERQKENYRVL